MKQDFKQQWFRASLPSNLKRREYGGHRSKPSVLPQAIPRRPDSPHQSRSPIIEGRFSLFLTDVHGRTYGSGPESGGRDGRHFGVCCWPGEGFPAFRCCFFVRCTAVFRVVSMATLKDNRKPKGVGRETKGLQAHSRVKGWTPFCFSSVSLQSLFIAPRGTRRCLQGLCGAFLAFPEFPRSFPDPLRGSSEASLYLRAPLRGPRAAVRGRRAPEEAIFAGALRGFSDTSQNPVEPSEASLDKRETKEPD